MMTKVKFDKFIKKRTPVKIIPDEVDGFKLVFDNGEKISISSGYDGIIYTHETELVKGNSKQLVKDLDELAPHFFKNIQEKYK